ncbi:hypothetical protein BGZ83_005980 [Gryganskiella cystojenkinii]|nr:hypothetical protein BGZ83_005980 [Gryganskiella cystojenkinii]
MSFTKTTGGSADLRILRFLIPAPASLTGTASGGGDGPTTMSTTSNTAVHTSSTRESHALAKLGTYDWTCQLSILEEAETIRATLAPIPATKANVAALGECCTLQVLGRPPTPSASSLALRNNEFLGPADPDFSLKPVLVTKRLRREDIFSRGIEFYLDYDTVWTSDDENHHNNNLRSDSYHSHRPHRGNSIRHNNHFAFSIILSTHPIKLLGPLDGPKWTHALKASETDPGDRTIDPLVEMMICFQSHSPSTDILFKFLSPLTGEEVEEIRAHQAILSIYPAFSERVFAAQADRNPHLRRTTTATIRGAARTAEVDGSSSSVTVLQMSSDRFEAFERMMSFIYSGLIPYSSFSILPGNNKGGSGGSGIDQWKTTFELLKEYGLSKCLSARPWLDWHTRQLRRLLTEENVLDVYFSWGFAHETVARDCVEFLVKRPITPLPAMFFSPPSPIPQGSPHQSRTGSFAQASPSSSSSSSSGTGMALLGMAGMMDMDESTNHVLRLVREQYAGRPGCVEFQDLFVKMKLELYHQQKQKKEQQQRQQPVKAK